VPCGLSSGMTNAATEGGVPSCAPPETFREQAGFVSGGWLWGPRSEGAVRLQVKGTDVAVALSLHGVVDNIAQPVNGDGQIAFVLRTTLRDPTNGAMTMIDLPLGVPVPVRGGKASVKTTFSAALAAAPYNGVMAPVPCIAIEVLILAVYDSNNDTFASPGVFLPSL
jgi:hypothetical protein